MARRPFWQGYLKLSLVTCRVRLEPARRAGNRVTFHTLNRDTGNRVESAYVDAETGRPVPDRALARGYPLPEGGHVMLDDREIEAVGLESARTIEIESFVPAADLGWIWLDRPHFLKPADAVGAEAFAVIRAALEETGTAALSRLVLYRREHAVALLPRETGMVLWTLRYGDEVRPAEESVPAKADARMTRLLGRVIAARTTGWSPKLVRDPVEERLRGIVAAKAASGRPEAPRTKAPARAPTDGDVVSIMDALKRSLAEGK